MRTVATALFLLPLGTSFALTDPASECNGSNQIEIGACVTDTLQRVDQTVALYLGFAMSSARDLDTVTQRQVAARALDAAQTSWETFRDTHCDFVGATFGGGSGTGIAIDSCRIELGRDRARELMRFSQ